MPIVTQVYYSEGKTLAVGDHGSHFSVDITDHEKVTHIDLDDRDVPLVLDALTRAFTGR